jgi:hypothetical protein
MPKAIQFIGALCIVLMTARAATVSGTVKDPSGAIIPGARVMLTGSPGAEVRTSLSGPDGQFHFADVQPGDYVLRVDHDGFESLLQQISVAGQDVSLALSLKIAAQQAAVEVEGGRSRLANADPNYRALRDNQPVKTWHVENVVLKRDVGTLTLRNGTVSFLPPVLGRTVVGVFTGDGHFHMDPLLAMEKDHLELITGARAVDEDFESVLLAFTDGTFEEITGQAKAADDDAKDSAALRDFHHELRHRTEEPRSMTEYMFAGESVPNLEAGLLAELYNPKYAGSFSAYIHGRKRAHLRFLINSEGAIPALSPEEVGLINLDPRGPEDGIWYLSHVEAEWHSGRASSSEDRRSFAVEHYRIETVLGKRDRLTAITEIRFHPLRDGDRVILPLTAFLDSTQRWRLMGTNAFRFADFIQEVTPHEVSHQWWGHMVGWASLHDQWLSEGFADFSAGLFLEMTNPKPDEYLHYLERAQKQIVEKNEYGKRPNDAGPLWLGLRLDTFKTERAYNFVVYPKGGYVLHMLRYLMQDQKTGDKDFIDMMHDFVTTYTNRNASTEDFKAIVEKHMKPGLDLDGNGKTDWFFHEWVYGTELPSYRLDYSLAPAENGKVMLTATVTQSDVSAAFRMRVPLYAEFDGRMTRLGWVPVEGSSTTKEFKVKLPKKPKRVVLCANYDVLASSITNHGN